MNKNKLLAIGTIATATTLFVGCANPLAPKKTTTEALSYSDMVENTVDNKTSDDYQGTSSSDGGGYSSTGASDGGEYSGDVNLDVNIDYSAVQGGVSKEGTSMDFGEGIKQINTMEIEKIDDNFFTGTVRMYVGEILEDVYTPDTTLSKEDINKTLNLKEDDYVEAVAQKTSNGNDYFMFFSINDATQKDKIASALTSLEENNGSSNAIIASCTNKVTGLYYIMYIDMSLLKEVNNDWGQNYTLVEDYGDGTFKLETTNDAGEITYVYGEYEHEDDLIKYVKERLEETNFELNVFKPSI